MTHIIQKFMLLRLLGFSVLIFTLSNGYSENKYTAESRIPNIGETNDGLLSDRELVRIGLNAVLQLNRGNGILDDMLGDFYLQQIGSRIASVVDFNHAIDAETYFFIVASRSLNAFALPAGYIGINYGLITKTKNEDELASVIAHELAHVSKRHILNRKEENTKGQGLLIAGIIAALLASSSQSESGSSIGNALLFSSIGAFQQNQLSFSRKQEEEADIFGLRYLTQAGFNPFAMASFHNLLLSFSSSTQAPEYLLSHPRSENRAAELLQRIQQIGYTKRKNKASQPNQRQNWYTYLKARLLALDDLREVKPSTVSKNSSPLELYTLALWNMRNNNFKLSNQYFEKLLLIDSENEFFLYSTAENYLEQKNISKAITYFKRVITLYPHFTPARIQLATAYLRQGKFQNACQSIRFLQEQNNGDRIIYPRDHHWLKISADCAYRKKQHADYFLYLSDSILAKGNLRGAINQLRLGLAAKNLRPETKKKFRERIKQIASLDPELKLRLSPEKESEKKKKDEG